MNLLAKLESQTEYVEPIICPVEQNTGVWNLVLVLKKRILDYGTLY